MVLVFTQFNKTTNILNFPHFPKPKMPKKGSPIFKKVSNLLKTSVFIPKMKRPDFPSLVFLKKSRKLKKMNLLKHYNYGYIHDYEFSPSNTPLIQYHRKPLKQRKLYRDMYSLLSLCSCLGDYHSEKESLPGIGNEVAIRELYAPSDSGSEEDSVDERAERFIERFYQEMRMEKRDSVLYLT